MAQVWEPWEPAVDGFYPDGFDCDLYGECQLVTLVLHCNVTYYDVTDKPGNCK